MPHNHLPTPQHWWNEHNHPTIAYGPFAFPAEILPYSLAFSFIFWKTYPGAGRQPVPADNAHEQQDPPAAAPQQDAMPGAPPAAVAQNLDIRAAQALAFFHNTLTMRALWFTEVHDPTKRDSIVPNLGFLCLVQAAALLLGGMVFGEPGSGLPNTIASVGWIVFKYSDYEAHLDLALAAFLAAPCVWKLIGPVGYGGQASGLLLLILVIDAALPAKAAVREWTFLWSAELWRFGVLLGAQLVQSLIDVVKSSPRLPQEGWSRRLKYISEAAASGLGAFGSEMLKLCTAFAMLAASMCFTGFMNACLSWHPLIFGMPAKSPFAGMAAMFLGGTSYIVPWALIMHFRRGRRPLVQMSIAEILRTESAFYGEAIGWSVTALTALHFVLSRIYSTKQ